MTEQEKDALLRMCAEKEDAERELATVRAQCERLQSEQRKADERWKKDTGDRLDSVEGAVKDVGDKVTTFLHNQKQRDTVIAEKYNEHHGVLFGTKESPESGVFLQLDRLKGTVHNITKIGWLLIGGLVTLVVSGVGTLIWLVVKP